MFYQSGGSSWFLCFYVKFFCTQFEAQTVSRCAKTNREAQEASKGRGKHGDTLNTSSQAQLSTQLFYSVSIVVTVCVHVYMCVCVSHFVAFVASVVFFSSLPFAASASASAACVAFAPLGVDIERRPASLVVTPIVQSEADALSSTVQCPRQREGGKWTRQGRGIVGGNR